VLDLVNEMSARIDSGEPSTSSTWLAVLRKRAGQWAVLDWQAMMEGKLILPLQGAFGPCLSPHPAKVGIFDLGFTRPVRLVAGSVIEGVAAGSPAQRAGLLDGDTLVDSVDINPLASSLSTPIELRVRRDARLRSVRFDPHRASRAGLRWTSTCDLTPTAVPPANQRVDQGAAPAAHGS
jgi:predicted metalloprotease with PDZ domain